MNKQLIISISREVGSGGLAIAKIIANQLNLPLYDYNIIKDIAKEKNYDAINLEKYDELPKNRFLSRNVMGYTNSPQEVVAQMQFDFIKDKAQSGESFVIVGRCSEEVLKGYDSLISIFVLADMETKISHIEDLRGMTTEEATSYIKKENKKRKDYHNYFCEGKWGDSRNYDISVNSSRLGIQETADMLLDYIKRRTN